MWRTLIRGTDWRRIVDLVSPSVFDVLPAGRVRQATGALVRRWRDGEGVEALRAERARSLAAAGIDVAITREVGGEPPLEPREVGERVLTLYFHQLFADDRALLDLRPARFGAVDGGLGWDPRPLWVAWDAEFVAGLRALYRGFYEDDDASFESGLARLGIGCARETFLSHFGDGDQRAVRFEVAHFTESFHETFVRCRDAGASLHADFVPLGLYLATLYDHLEPLGVPLDVRAAYERARR